MQKRKPRLSAIECYVHAINSFIKRNNKYVQMAVTIIAILAALLFFVLNGDKSPNVDSKQSSSISKLNESHDNSKRDTDKKNTKSKSKSDKKKAKSIGKSNKKAERRNLIIVDISGEVKKPGVYKITAGTRIYELIRQAGGLTENANADMINRASTVADGQKIVIPSKVITESPSQVKNDRSETSATGRIVNINQADQKQLEEIAGIGTAMARRIIEYRDLNGYFSSIDELMNVKGIGVKKFDKIKAYVTV